MRESCARLSHFEHRIIEPGKGRLWIYPKIAPGVGGAIRAREPKFKEGITVESVDSLVPIETQGDIVLAILVTDEI